MIDDSCWQCTKCKKVFDGLEKEMCDVCSRSALKPHDPATFSLEAQNLGLEVFEAVQYDRKLRDADPNEVERLRSELTRALATSDRRRGEVDAMAKKLEASEASLADANRRAKDARILAIVELRELFLLPHDFAPGDLRDKWRSASEADRERLFMRATMDVSALHTAIWKVTQEARDEAKAAGLALTEAVRGAVAEERRRASRIVGEAFGGGGVIEWTSIIRDILGKVLPIPASPPPDLVRDRADDRARAPRIRPVTDPEEDAPDGANVDGYTRVGDQWILNAKRR